jgi:hypothetical protein
MTKRKRLVFATIAIALALGIPLGALLAIDVYFHHRVERDAGLNIWGYRGPTVPGKKPGEHRLVVLGGSAAFGYGVRWDQAFPARLEAGLRPLARNHAPVSVVNLAMNAQGAYSFKYVLEDYLGLEYDTAIFYEGYNDLGGEPNLAVGRRDSPVFRLTGYFPIFPIAFTEKAMAIRHGGDLDGAYRGKATVFKPGLASRATASALETAANIANSVERQLGNLSRADDLHRVETRLHVTDSGCSPTWAHYCGAVYDAARFALDRGKRVLVVTQPYIDRERHPAQQAELRTMLAARFKGNRSVGYANLGDLIDLKSPLAYDGMHLTSDGNAIIAAHLLQPVADLMPESFERPTPPDPAHSTP